MANLNILWADDEIDLLKPHVLFLEDKGYTVDTVTNGDDALESIKKKRFDIVFLDENMPGLSGLETLVQLKNINPNIPVVMITKSEEEFIMEEAIGSKIADYLIKPVNPNQILLTIKKNLDDKRLISEKTTAQYQQEFRNIGTTLNDHLDYEEWIDVYKKLIYWELELEKSKDESMYEILTMQKNEANNLFGKFIEKNYVDWLKGGDDAPVMSHNVVKKWLYPVMEQSKDPVFFIVIDNLRYDQWKVIQHLLNDHYRLDDERAYYSILPTATQYARNAMFAGMMPLEISKRYPKMWLNDEDEGGKNLYEKQFLEEQLKKFGSGVKFSYNKITNLEMGKALADNVSDLFSYKLNVIVYNFVDMLSHARTDMQMIKELADDESAYRSITQSWFLHSPLFEILKKAAEKSCKVILTTDHGTIRVKEPSKVIGDKKTSTNLRYKCGRNLNYEKKDVLEIRNPEDAQLPKTNLSTSFVFIKQDKFFAYPNNYNYYVNYYRDTFQHGGISPEEMIIPFAILSPK